MDKLKLIDTWLSDWYNDLKERKVHAPTHKLLFPKNSNQRKTLIALLATTAQVESDWQFTKQIGGGPAVSIFQIEMRTALEIWKRKGLWIKDFELINKQIVDTGLFKETLCDVLCEKQSIAMSVARLVYYRTPKAMPHNVNWEELWGYYKRYYNTYTGATTKERWYDSTAKIRADYDRLYRK